MNNSEAENTKRDGKDEFIEDADLLQKIENSYKVYKLCELFLKDIADDYGKTKLARLRYDFARHELIMLLKEAKNKGIELKDNELVKKLQNLTL